MLGISGYSRSGKDTVADFLVQHHGFTRIAFASPIYEMLLALNPVVSVQSRNGSPYGVRLGAYINQKGWDEAKTLVPEIRHLLQRLGTEAGRAILGENIWVDTAMRQAQQFARVCFSDVRFPNEAQAILDGGGVVIRVNRPEIGPVNRHVSDKGLPDELVSFELDNDGTLEELREKVDVIMGAEAATA